MAKNMKSKNNFTNYIISDFISQFGSGMTLTTVGWFVIDMTNKSSGVSMFYNINILCGILIALCSGFILDFFDKKKLLLSINLFRVLTLFLSLLLLYNYGYNI
jgi:MFS family permease